MLKKIISIILVALTTLGCFSLSVYAVLDQRPDYSIEANYNNNITEDAVINISEDAVALGRSRSNKTMSVELSRVYQYTEMLVNNQTGEALFNAEGEFPTVDGYLDYFAEGKLLVVEYENGSTGLVGNLIGSLSNDEHINISLHSIPEENKSFIYVSVGYLTNDSMPEIYIFGDTFDKLSELTEEYVGQQAGVYTLNPDEEYIPETIIEPTSTIASADDYNTTIRSMAIGTARTMGGAGAEIQLAACTLYTPYRIKANGSYKVGVKLNGHSGNAAAYFRGQMVLGVLSAWHSRGTVTVGSIDNEMEFHSLDPEDENFQVTLNVPGLDEVSSIFKWFPVSFNILFSTIKTERYKNEGSILYNVATWKHNYSEDMSWENGNPITTPKGYCGQATITYYKNRDVDYTTLIETASVVSYEFRSQYGVETYTGNVSVRADGAYANVVVDATN